MTNGKMPTDGFDGESLIHRAHPTLWEWMLIENHRECNVYRLKTVVTRNFHVRTGQV